MHFTRALVSAGFLISNTLAAPLLLLGDHDLSTRDYDIELDYAARSWLDDDAVAARSLAGDEEELTTRAEDYEDFLLTRNKAKALVSPLLQAAKKIRTGLKTKPGEPVFWSGNSPGPKGGHISAGKTANHFAVNAKPANSKPTLQMKLKQEGIKMPKYNPKDRSAQVWRMASKKFASGASGTIHAFLGTNVNQNGIYKKEENPRLQKKPTVSKLIEHIHGKPPQVVKGAHKHKK